MDVSSPESVFKSVARYAGDIYRLHRPVWNWRWFAWKVRSKGCCLLSAANYFNRPVFVSGCQRSGTTLVARVIRQSPEIADIRFSNDDELDGAYILCGKYRVDTFKRYCFQTTYVNECYKEYLGLKVDYRLVWVLRNPFSVVYSMVYNWPRYPLRELYRACGKSEAERAASGSSGLRVSERLSPLEQACYSYCGKLRQLTELAKQLDDTRLLVINYEDLVQRRQVVMPKLFDFVGVAYEPEYARLINDGSLQKADGFRRQEEALVRKLCGNLYESAKRLAFSA